MFSQMKDKLFNVHNEISSSFKTFTLGEIPIVDGRSLSGVNSGAELIAKYQQNWQIMHEATEINAKLASKIDQDIQNVNNNVEKQYKLAKQLFGNFENLNKLILATEIVVNLIGNVRHSIENIQEGLLDLENLIEEQTLKNWQNEETKKLEAHRAVKLENFDRKKAELSYKHIEKVNRLEDEKCKELQEKWKIYDEKSRADLDYYRKMGKMPPPTEKKDSNTNSTNISDVEILDQNLQDLEAMLQDES